MPRRFLYLVATAQVFISAIHIILFFCVAFFFPAIINHNILWFTLTMLLSIFFFGSLVLTFKYNNLFTRTLYRIGSVWMGLFFHIGVATAISLVVYVVAADFTSVVHFWKFAATMYIIAIAFTVYGLINKLVIRTVQLSLDIKNLPEQWKQRKIIFMSDLHLGRIQWTGFSERVVSLIKNHAPDMVLIGGDLFDGGAMPFEKLMQPFKDLRINQGIYFVTGNHEKYPDDPKTLEHITNAGIKIIDDQLIDVDGLLLAGIGYHEQETLDEFLGKLHSLKIDPKRPTIMLKHVPDPNHIEMIEQAGVDLQLSGHTHRGQTYPFRHITKRLFNGFDYGLKRLRDLQVYTSSGIGIFGPPMRIGTQSEIILITFK